MDIRWGSGFDDLSMYSIIVEAKHCCLRAYLVEVEVEEESEL